jgi:PIN domain nuclease of toxin-antitoxin system
LAQQQGKLLLPCSAQEWCQTALFPVGIDIFPLTPDIAFRAVHLSPIHRDPFDRIIMATALEYQAKLVSVDRMIILYPELLNCLLQ